MTDTSIPVGVPLSQPPNPSELEKLNSYTDEGTGEQQAEEQQATQPSTEAIATEEQPSSKGGTKKRVSRKKSSAAVAGEKRGRGERGETAAGEGAVELKEKKAKRTRTTKAAQAEAKAAEGEAETGEVEGEAVKAPGGAKKKGPGRPRKSSKKEKEEVAAAAFAPEEGDAPTMKVDVGSAEAEKAPVAEGEASVLTTVIKPELAKRKRGPGRPKKSEPADTTATVDYGEVTKEAVPAARTRGKEGSEKMQQQPAVAAA